jgi:hypothetical protein
MNDGPIYLVPTTLFFPTISSLFLFSFACELFHLSRHLKRVTIVVLFSEIITYIDLYFKREKLSIYNNETKTSC